jgi:acetyl/propionyl-CoA carboxylase alpha subunit
MFDRVVIASRGESAIRIARTCERMGISTIGVYIEADADSPHVRACDEARCLNGGGSREAYLDTDAIIEAARKSQADAIHPGYGALGIRADFARAVKEAGLKFVGPDPDSIERFADRARTRSVAAAAGIRLLEGTDGAILDPETAAGRATAIGYPVRVRPVSRAAAGASRAAADDEELERTVAETITATGPGLDPPGVCLERHVFKPRHLEVQVLVDANGDAIALGEQECSLRKDGRRLIGESPAPALTGISGGELKREILWDSALRVARECSFRNVGTAEFLMDPEGRLHFRDFRPTLSPSHAAIEFCSGIDLVELQIRIAAGERLPDEVRRVQPSGHAFEAHLHARLNGGTPDAEERITELRWPSVVTGKLRIETGLSVGARIGSVADAPLAKVATYGTTRHRALLTLDRVLAEAAIAPVTTNLDLLREILSDEAFQTGQYDATFSETRFRD